MTRWPLHLIKMISVLWRTKIFNCPTVILPCFSLSSHSWWSLNYALGISLPCILCSFLPLPIDAFHLKLNRLKISLIVETVIVPCVFNVRPLIVVFMYEQGFFLGNAHCVLIDPSQLWLCQRNTTGSNSQMTVSKPVGFVQELNKGITGTNPFSKLILVY